MIKVFLASFIATLLIFSGCNLDSEKNIETAPSESLPAIVTATEPVITDVITTRDNENFLDKDNIATAPRTDYLVSEQIEYEIPEFRYETFLPDESFLAALEDLSDEQLELLNDNPSKFYEIGNYVLLYKNNVKDEIVVYSENGGSQTIFSANKTIQDVSFYNRHTLYVKMFIRVPYDGGIWCEYFFDLRTGEFEENSTSGNRAMEDTIPNYKSYKGKWFEIYGGWGERQDLPGIYRFSDSGKAELLVEQAELPLFRYNKLFFKKDTFYISIDLETLEQQKVYEFADSSLDHAWIFLDKLYYSYPGSGTLYVTDIGTKETILIERGGIKLINVLEDGVYAFDTDGIFNLYTYDGGKIPIMRGFTPTSFIVKGDVIYFVTRETDDFGAPKYFYWKMKIDGSGLVRL